MFEIFFDYKNILIKLLYIYFIYKQKSYFKSINILFKWIMIVGSESIFFNYDNKWEVLTSLMT